MWTADSQSSFFQPSLGDSSHGFSWAAVGLTRYTASRMARVMGTYGSGAPASTPAQSFQTRASAPEEKSSTNATW